MTRRAQPEPITPDAAPDTAPDAAPDTAPDAEGRLMASPDGDVCTIVDAGVAALEALGWTFVD